MSEQIRLLEAEIRTDLATIGDVFARLEAVTSGDIAEQEIVAGYYINVLYGHFENLFVRIAAQFGNKVKDESQWHAYLLKRMMLDVPEIRPAIISPETHDNLSELRRFRHLFRNAYLLTFDPRRLNIVLEHAWALRQIYEADLNRFLDFLASLR